MNAKEFFKKVFLIIMRLPLNGNLFLVIVLNSLDKILHIRDNRTWQNDNPGAS